MNATLSTALVAFSTLFATIGPIESAMLFAALTPRLEPAERRRIAIRATLIASAVLLFFALLGGPTLRALGVTLAALEAAGGVLLLLIAIEMIYSRSSNVFHLSPDEAKEAERKEDISVVPLAMPILAGPGAIGGVIVLSTKAEGDPVHLALVVVALVATMAVTYALLVAATWVRHRISDTAVNVITRVMGILLAALAMQFLFNGIAESKIFGTRLF
jgi:multiple antibiotic resistance protein